MAAGNRSVLVLIDSRLPERRSADLTVFAALDHFGVAWEVLDGGDYMGAVPDYLAPRALYVVGHDGGAAWLKPEAARELADAVAAGAGLVSFDRRVADWPTALRALLPSELGTARAGVLRFADTPAWPTTGHEPGEELELFSELDCLTAPADPAWQPLVTAADGRTVIAAGRHGAGRVIWFGTGEQLYAESVYGHVRGLDGLMWRSLVQAAAKPFPMRCLPPYVTARVDDCNGTYNAFAWVDVLNRYGIGPNLGLFIDELGPTDWAAAKRLYDAGGADFSMHAFRDDFYMSRPNYRPFAVLPDKPDLSHGGTETRFEGLSLDHQTGLDLPDGTVRENFARVDAAFGTAGIRHSRVLNSHFGEVGARAVPYFVARGVDMPCNNAAFGQLYGNQPVWRPGPYGLRGTNGRYGLTIDRSPHHPQMTFISMHPSHVGRTHMVGDILSGRVPFLDEAPTPKLAEAAQAGIDNVKLGLDALAFGVVMTHEERINALSPDDWETIVTRIVRGLDGVDVQYALREHVGVVCKRLFDTRLVRANLTGDGLACELTGQSDGPSPLTVWENDGDGCVRRVVEVAPVDGFAAVRA